MGYLLLWNVRARQCVCGFSVPNETDRRPNARRISNQKTISALSVCKERPGTYSQSGQAKTPQIKNTPRLAKRASLRSPRRTRRSKCAQTMLCAYGFCIDVRTSAWIIRRQAKSHAPIRMRDCSSSKSLRMAICIRSILFWTNPQTRQWCQNSANKMIIGSGTPSSHSKAPLPKPIVASHFSHMNLTRTPFVSSSAQITSRARVHGPRARNFSMAVLQCSQLQAGSPT
jgi:hypothetical protein